MTFTWPAFTLPLAGTAGKNRPASFIDIEHPNFKERRFMLSIPLVFPLTPLLICARTARLSASFSLLLLVVVITMSGARAETPALMLARNYSGSPVLEHYWVSEKLDGVRAYWNGKQLISRQGNVFSAPQWFIEDFPSVALDGELWAGRGTFAELSGVVRQLVPDDGRWREVRYMVFDLPDSPQIFDRRLEQLKELIKDTALPHLQMVAQYRVKDHASLMRDLEQVVAQGGEGLMLHHGKSRYHAARSDDLLKLKTYDDAEAVVIAHLPGKGKYSGMMGALLVETAEGRRFKIGTGFTDVLRADPPPPGTLITYKYFGVTHKNIPRFASFLRVRHDLDRLPAATDVK
jgi:DNA ligase-1